MFALDDLYNNSPTAKPVISSASKTNATTNPNPVINFLNNFNVSYWAVEINQWLLAFTVFYSFWFLMDFLFWKVYHHEGSVDNEQTGQDALNHLNKMWLAYLVYLAVWSVAIANQGFIREIFEWASLIVALIVLIGVDLPMIPVIGHFFAGASAEGNVFTQVWNVAFSLVTQIWTGILEAVGLESPTEKAEKK